MYQLVHISIETQGEAKYLLLASQTSSKQNGRFLQSDSSTNIIINICSNINIIIISNMISNICSNINSNIRSNIISPLSSSSEPYAAARPISCLASFWLQPKSVLSNHK